MDESASRIGWVISALGGMAAFVSVFLSWYGVAFTQAAVDFADGAIGRVFPQWVGSSYETQMRTASTALVGHPVLGLTAHQVLTNTSMVLMVAGALAVALSLLALATGQAFAQMRGALALIGFAAAALVVYRMLHSPNPVPALMTLSLRGGAYLALLGSLAIAVGGLWPRQSLRSESSAPAGSDVWGELSGWTPSG